MFLHLISDEDKKVLEKRSKEINAFIQKELLDKIFHVTSISNLKGIQSTEFIKPVSESENFGQSKECFARRKGWVSFFDFRNKTNEQITDTTEKCLYTLLDKLDDPVVLVLQKSCYSKLKYQERHTSKEFESDRYLSLEKILETTGTYVPYTECWYPGDIPYSEIAESIQTKFHKQPEGVKELFRKISK